MTKLEQLIEELCPNGVERKSIGEICDICRGRVMSKDYISENKGEYPVYSSQTENNGELGRIATFDFDGEYLSWTTDGANAGTVFYRNGKFSVTNVCGLLKIKNDGLLTKYLYYTLNAEAPNHVNSGMGNPKLMSNVMAKITIPIPPLAVQEEIVRILDAFTELTAELTARKQQYEYYCRFLIDNANGAIETRIRDFGKWSGGMTPSMNNKSFWENGTIPWVSSKDMKQAVLRDTQDHITQKALEETSIKLLPKETIAIVARSGILKHTLPVVYIPIEVTVNQDIKVLVSSEKILPKYAYYCLVGYQSDLLTKTKKQGGTVDSLEIDKFMDYKIPVPSISEQERIIAILDRFDTLCNNISEGLPAEIEARQKQYEYYRDKLLTFEPAK